MIDITTVGLLLLSITCVVAGLVGRIPIWWFLGDAISCLTPAVLLPLFRYRKAVV